MIAMRVFHWNMTPPNVALINQRRRRRAGFAREGATAYMGLTRRATHDRFDDRLFRIARLKNPENEIRLVRSGRNDYLEMEQRWTRV
jgi:hypothetical protein